MCAVDKCRGVRGVRGGTRGGYHRCKLLCRRHAEGSRSALLCSAVTQAERMAENAELAKALRAAKAAGKGVHISY